MKKHLTTAAALAFAALFLGACDLITSPEDKKDDPVATTATFAAAADTDGNGTVSWSPEGTSFAKGTVITVAGTGTAGYSLASWKDASGAVVSHRESLFLHPERRHEPHRELRGGSQDQRGH